MAYELSDYYLVEPGEPGRPRITPLPGHSGYFSSPDVGFDPALFNGDILRADVAEHIRRELYTFWIGRYKNPHSWSRLWLAGSGISHQWAGDRGNGDLDVMVGIDADRFRDDNPVYSGLSDEELSDHVNGELKAWLWPKTAHTKFGGKSFEVTYYYNPGTTADPNGVLNINPYAAYDLISLSWTVRPPNLPANPRLLYPRDWWDAVDREAVQARGIIARYNDSRDSAARMPADSPGRVNAVTQMRMAASQASALFDSIHTGRKAAFSPGGKGYGDWANFRWQASKANGVGPALAEIVNVSRTSIASASTALYGEAIDSAPSAISKALMWTQARGVA